MDLSEELGRLNREIISIKTQQDTGGDSALLYRQVYNPGIYLGDSYKRRVHTIVCLTEETLDKCIFMPVVEGGLGVQRRTPDSLSLRDFSNEIVWIQWAMDSTIANNSPDTATFAARGITIYSNVPFWINTSYYDIES